MKNKYEKITTPPFVLAFPTLIEPKPDQNGNPPLKYSIKMMFKKDMTGKDLELFNAMKAAISKMAKDTFADKDGKVPKSVKNPLKDGDESDYEGDNGYFVASARTQRKPGVVDQSCRLLSDNDVSEKLYPGCICRATILVGAYNIPSAKGVNLMLQNVQFLGEGTRLGGAAKSATDDFEATETSEAASDFG
jgi:hypothetical protein